MKRLGTCAVLLSMIAAVVVSAGYLRSVRMQRVVPATVPPDERIFRARLLFAGDVIICHRNRSRTECIGFNNIRTCFQILTMNILNYIGTCQTQ